jgi:DNA-binding protein H-NS
MLDLQQPPPTDEDDVKKSDIETMNFKQLKAFVDAANARMQDMRHQEIQEARTMVQQKCEELGVSIYELMGIAPMGAPRAKAKGTNGSKEPAKARYSLPGGETWSGRGRAPRSVKELLGAAGVNESGFLTDEGKEEMKRYAIQ